MADVHPRAGQIEAERTDEGPIDGLFDEPSLWRAEIAEELGLDGLELHQALGAGPAYPGALRAALSALPRGAEATIVDVGCGTGATSDLIREETGATLIGCEPSSGSLEVAARLFPALRLVRGDAAAVPLRSGSVDAVVLNGVVSLLADIGPALDEARRLLVAGGVVALTDLVLADGTGPQEIGPNTFRSLDDLAAALHAHGFDTIEVGAGTPWPRPDWAGPQEALDDLTLELHEDDPRAELFSDDRAHLDRLREDGTLLGGCVVGRARPASHGTAVQRAAGQTGVAPGGSATSKAFNVNDTSV